MYLGVKSFHKLPAVCDYDSAKRALDIHEAMSKRGRRKDSVNFYDADKSIAFQLYETEVVTWYPDNSVEINNYGTMTTSGFADHFLPSGIRLRYPTSRHGNEGGDKAISFLQPGGNALCQGDYVIFREVDGYWVPDENTLNTVTMPSPVRDHKAARALAKQYNIRDFDNWLSMAQNHLDLEHEGYNLWACMKALEARDFRAATANMPTVKDTGAFGQSERAKPYRIEVFGRDQYISATCIGKLRLAIMEDAGLIEDDDRKVWPRDEYDKRKRRVAELEVLSGGCYGRYGFDA